MGRVKEQAFPWVGLYRDVIACPLQGDMGHQIFEAHADPIMARIQIILSKNAVQAPTNPKKVIKTGFMKLMCDLSTDSFF